MKAWVVYESMFGNTRTVAHAVARGLSLWMDVETFEVAEAPRVTDPDVRLVVLGAPTHRFGLSRADSRLAATKEAQDTFSTSAYGMRDWIADLEVGSSRTTVAAFDTCVDEPRWLRFAGSAARSATRKLRRRGIRIAARPETFFVSGMSGPLGPDEVARAEAWAARIAAGAVDDGLAAA